MNVSQSFRLALKSLMVSKVRALLTMLGIMFMISCAKSRAMTTIRQS